MFGSLGEMSDISTIVFHLPSVTIQPQCGYIIGYTFGQPTRWYYVIYVKCNHVTNVTAFFERV